MAQTNIQALPGRQDIIVTRTYNVPRDLVYKTVTNPSLIPEWCGPRNLTTRVERMDVRPGGQWRFIQHDPQGNTFAFHGVYHAVEIPRQLIYTSKFEGMPGHVALYTEDLAEQDGETVITTHGVFQSVEDRDQLLQWGMEEGVSEQTRRLNALLTNQGMTERKANIMERMEENGECITLTRTFDAPLEEVWERWTDPSQYMCWWGPKDFTSPYAKFDLRPGGTYLTSMRGPDCKEYWDTGKFEKIDELNRIVYTDTWADQNGNPVPPSYYGFLGDKPVEMAAQVNLENIGGKTRLTLEHCGFPGGEMIDQAKEGWNQSFNKLAECLR
jgi:uncharacterized protein YndB with AHSA1/START domain